MVDIISNSTEIEPSQINTINTTIDSSQALDNNANSDINPNINPNKTNKTKKVFLEECNKCNKVFKNKATYEKHTKQQLCYNKQEITYCKTCDITLETHSNYIRHLMTAKHLESIGAGKLEKLKDDKPGFIHTADPYLSKTEAELLGTQNLGEKYTLVYENDEIQEVKLIHKQQANKVNLVNLEQNNKNIITQTLPTTHIEHNTPINEYPPEKITHPTKYQIEIIKFLEQQTNPIEANNSFIKVLTTKLALEDYYGLSTLIRENTNIILEVKNIILGLINKFVEGLTKKRANGQTTYNNKDIAKVVIALSM